MCGACRILKHMAFEEGAGICPAVTKRRSEGRSRKLDGLRREGDGIVDNLLADAESQITTEFSDEFHSVLGLSFKMESGQQSDCAHRSKPVAFTGVPRFLE